MKRIIAAALLFAGMAFASTILTPTGVDWSRGASIWMNENGSDIQAYFAGVIYISLQENGLQYDRDTLCVDLFTDIVLGVTYDTTVLHPSQVSGKNLDRVSWLVDNALLPTQNSHYLSDLPKTDWVFSAAQGAGIQLAIWDIVHDQGDGFSAGSVRASTNPSHPTDPQVLSWAQTYQALSAGKSSGLAFIYDNVDRVSGQPAQMLAGPLFTDAGPSPNPEPPTLALMGTALILVGSMRRKRRG